MLTPSQHALGHRIALLLVRLSVGLYLFLAGKNKAFAAGQSMRQSVSAWMEKYQDSVPPWLPSFIATPYGYTIPWLEMALGLLLALGLFFRVTAIATTLMMLSIAIAVMGETGLFPDGRFRLHHSLIFTTVAFLLIFTGPGGLSVDALLPKRRKAR